MQLIVDDGVPHRVYLWSVSGYSWVETWRSHLTQTLSPVLEAIIDKLLQQDYRDRYQSSDEVLEALEQIAVTHSSRSTQPQVNSSGVDTTILNVPKAYSSTQYQSQIPSNVSYNSTSGNPGNQNINSNQNSSNNVQTSGIQPEQNPAGKIVRAAGGGDIIINARNFNLVENSKLRAKMPQSFRTQAFNGVFEIPTLDEIINLVKQ